MTPALLATTRGAPDSRTLRRALTGWAFNTKRRDEPKLLTANRLSEVKWTAPKTVRAIDKRVVISPQQAKSLLSEVEAQRIEGRPRRSSGPMLVALLLSETAPITGAAWTDSGERRDRRQLKQRGKGEVRPVPSPPPLTAILHT